MDCEGGEEPWRIGVIPFDFEISPNPATSVINVKISREIQDFELSIFDMQTGELVKSRKYKKSNNSIDFNINNLKSGQYSLQINSGSYISTKKFTVI